MNEDEDKKPKQPSNNDIPIQKPTPEEFQKVTKSNEGLKTSTRVIKQG